MINKTGPKQTGTKRQTFKRMSCFVVFSCVCVGVKHYQYTAKWAEFHQTSTKKKENGENGAKRRRQVAFGSCRLVAITDRLAMFVLMTFKGWSPGRPTAGTRCTDFVCAVIDLWTIFFSLWQPPAAGLEAKLGKKMLAKKQLVSTNCGLCSSRRASDRTDLVRQESGRSLKSLLHTRAAVAAIELWDFSFQYGCKLITS